MKLIVEAASKWYRRGNVPFSSRWKHQMSTLTLLLIALILDAILGDPDWLWGRFAHPATLMGRAVEWLDDRLNHGDYRRTAGILAITALILGALILGLVIKILPDAGLLEALLAAILLAQRSLVDHVSQVATALRSSLIEGRRAVSMIVGRDPEELDESAVARGAIESAAENFSDGVIAPAFWFLVLGLPGILIYKVINTADSMIGHRSERFQDFGWATARIDDLVNWIPARISGAIICLAYWSKTGWDSMLVDAKNHRSPNAGWPEAAMAGVLGIAVSGPRSYNGTLSEQMWVNDAGRTTLTPDDIDAAVRVLWRSWFVGVGILAVWWVIF